jgi:hypothetical protein
VSERLDIDLTPLSGVLPPRRARLRWGPLTRILGAHDGWRLRCPAPGPAAEVLRVEPEGRHRLWFGLRVDLAGWPRTLPARLPLVPRDGAVSAPYVDLLDLLQEFLYPRSGSRISRWPSLPLRVAVPARETTDPYVVTCRQAVDLWNEVAGETWLLAVGAEDSAAVRCAVSEEAPLGYTRIVSRSADGDATRMLVHLSPRFHPDFPRYIRRAWAHEFGHALGLWGHSVVRDHLLYGRAVLVDRPHPDEVEALRRLYALPVGFRLRWIQRRWSAPDSIQIPSPCALRSADLPLPR